MLLTAIYAMLAVFILYGMCPWKSSWPDVELRHNNHEERVKLLTISGNTEYPKDQLRARRKVSGCEIQWDDGIF